MSRASADALVAFLRARLAEEVQCAEGSGVIAWLTYRDADGGMLYTRVAATTVGAPDHWVSDGREMTGWHSARVVYDERLVLADVAAKRQIIQRYVDVRDIWRVAPMETDRIGQLTLAQQRRGGELDGLWRAMTFMAVVYADHPDYLEEWRP